jgi:hypothetical protein
MRSDQVFAALRYALLLLLMLWEHDEISFEVGNPYDQ